jgi:P-type conjugative transfer protein TrbG
MKKFVLILLGIFLMSGFVYANQTNINARSIMNTNLMKNTDDVYNASILQADYIYDYIPNRIYKVYCSDSRIVDIQFQLGEEIIYIGGADAVRWIIDKDVSGSGDYKINHLFVKAVTTDISTNLVVTTNKRAYHLELISTNSDSITPIIRWNYPLDERLTFLRVDLPVVYNTTEISDASNDIELLDPDSLNFGYKIVGNDFSWKPVLVFDNGLKTYIQMPKTMHTSEAPVLYINSNNGLALVNYRIKDGYYIIDRLGELFEMRVGKNVVKIIKEGETNE